MSDSVAEHYMDKLEHQKAITESCSQTIGFLQKKVENQRRELKRRTHAIGDLVRIRAENQRLKEFVDLFIKSFKGTAIGLHSPLLSLLEKARGLSQALAAPPQKASK